MSARDPHLTAHRVEQAQANVQDLVDRGETLERALARVGLSHDTWEKQAARLARSAAAH